MTTAVDLDGRRVLVSGASSGLGEAICRSVVAMMLGLPDGICINEVVVRPTGQLSP